MTPEKTTKEQASTRTRELRGVVVSNKTKDTVVVAVTRYVKHPKYRKFIKRVKRYQAHNPGNTKELGENVTIVESQPISKHKHFKIQ